MTEQTFTKAEIEEQSPSGATFNIKDLLMTCLSSWKWILLSVIFCVGLAYLYTLRTPRIYTQYTDLQFKNMDEGGGSIDGMAAFSNMGLFHNDVSVHNEIMALSSPALMSEVVKRLHLDMNYSLPGRFHPEVAYGDNLPVEASLVDIDDETPVGFNIQIDKDGKIKLSDFSLKGQETPSKNTINAQFGDTVTTPIGKIVLRPAAAFTPGKSFKIKVNRIGFYPSAAIYLSRLSTNLKKNNASVVNITISDQSRQRANDILDMLVNVYNENWIRDRNQMSISTSNFINERLAVIEQELGAVENDISSFKSEHLLSDVNTASSMYLTKTAEANAQLMTLNNELYMTKYIRAYLTDEKKRYELLPANSGISASGIESQISSYNNLLLERNSLLANSSLKNPLVIDLDSQLDALRGAIISSIDNLLVTLNTQIKTLERSEQQNTALLAANPSQAKYLLSVERQQKVKEALYLFLLQKREENELSQAFTAYNTRVITPPTGNGIPTSPKTKSILMMAFVVGLLLPIGIIFLHESMNTRIRSRKDLDALTIPLVGNIPQHGVAKMRSITRAKNHHSATEGRMVVKEGSRNIINEAFRLARTNIEFMSASTGGKNNVIAITSFNPGSGKTFLSMNLGAALAIKGKKVLVIDGDMRRGTTSTYVGSPKLGLSDYLGHRTEDLSKIIVSHNDFPTLSVMPIGTLPPNPTELLFDQRLEEMLSVLREKFDYILIDCPPVDIVADMQIIERHVDRTIFVVRVGLLERSMLPELESMYRTNRFKNMSVILNGAQLKAYGRYGYNYGYYNGKSSYYNKQ